MIQDQYTENGMKVYCDNEGEWYASPLGIKETKDWVVNELGYNEEEFDLVECDLDNGGAWLVTADERYIKELGDYDEKCKGGIGDLRRSLWEENCIERFTSFREVLKEDGYSKEPYEIASTNY